MFVFDEDCADLCGERCDILRFVWAVDVHVFAYELRDCFKEADHAVIGGFFIVFYAFRFVCSRVFAFEECGQDEGAVRGECGGKVVVELFFLGEHHILFGEWGVGACTEDGELHDFAFSAFVEFL